MTTMDSEYTRSLGIKASIGFHGWIPLSQRIKYHYLYFLNKGQSSDITNIFESTQIFFASLIFGTISFLPAGIGITEITFIEMLINNEESSLDTASALILFIRLTTIWFITLLGFISLRFFVKKSNKNNISN